MADGIEAVKRILSRWMHDPEAEYPYLLPIERFDEYRASEEEWLDPDVELDFAAGTAGLPGLETRGRGREDFWRLWRAWLEAWGEYRMEFSNWDQHGEAVIVDLEVVASGQRSGVPVSLSVTQIWLLRGGRLASLRVFGSRRRALAALEDA